MCFVGSMVHFKQIQYRDFYDVPRMFIVRHRDHVFLFDCPFDEGLDEYPDHYSVYLLSPISSEELDGSWTNLSQRAICNLGQIPVNSVVFDPTRRRSIDGGGLDALLENEKS